MRRPPATWTILFAMLALLACAPATASATADPALLQVTQSRGTAALTEGDEGYAFTVSLRQEPAVPVTVAVSAAGLDSSAATISFGPGLPLEHRVTVTAPDDDVDSLAVDRRVTLTSASTDLEFDALTRAFDVNVHDDDAVGVYLDHTGDGTEVTEGADTDTVLLRLGTRPQEPVTVFLEGIALHASPDMVVVRPDRWNDGIPVVLSAPADQFAQGGRDTTITARTRAPKAVWTDRSAVLPVTVHDSTALRATVPGPGDPTIPGSVENRTPSTPVFRLPEVWPGTGSVGLRFASTDPDNDAVRYRVLHRRHAWGAPRPKDWELLGEVTSTTFDAGPIAPLEQRCFRIEAVDPMGAAASTSVSCTHGMADEGSFATRYSWATKRMRGAWNGTVAYQRRVRLLYFTHTGSHAQLTFWRCRTCASIEVVDVEDEHRTISLRGTGKRVVTVPLRATGRRTWGFYVRGPGDVYFDSFAVVRDPA